jgi:hypothetical protein
LHISNTFCKLVLSSSPCPARDEYYPNYFIELRNAGYTGYPENGSELLPAQIEVLAVCAAQLPKPIDLCADDADSKENGAYDREMSAYS